MSEHDLSNMGRCVKCGSTVDMRDEEDTLVLLDPEPPDLEGIDEQDVRDGMARAIRRVGEPEDEPLAVAYEDGDEIVLHEHCHDESALPDLYATDEEMEALGLREDNR